MVRRVAGEAKEIETLIAESEQDGLRFVRRLDEEWVSGVNHFDRPDVGRVRHLYILAAHRRLGIARRLVTEVIGAARGRFDILRLSTNNPIAAQCYERLGFRRSDDSAHCTHVMALR